MHCGPLRGAASTKVFLKGRHEEFAHSILRLMMDHPPRRTRANRTIAGMLVQRMEATLNSPEIGATHETACIVTCSRHSDRELGGTPCVLSKSLQGMFSANALLRVVSKQQPDLRFYARAHTANFAQSVKGISILATISEAAKINDKDVELREVSEEEAQLAGVVMVISDRYLSKRDIWHMHLAMMEDGAELLYSSYSHNLQSHIPNSRIEKLIGPGQCSMFCGLVTRSTEVSLKSSSATMFVLLQLSTELFATSFSGRPYWELLLECLAQLIEKSLKTSASDGNGHYIRLVLFGRAWEASKHPCQDKCRCDFDMQGPAPSHAGLYGVTPERDSSTSTFLTVDQASADHEDFYSTIWEGFAKAIPPGKYLINAVRRTFIDLHGQVITRSGRIPQVDGCRPSSSELGVPACYWDGVDANDVVEASRGNVLECLNIVLDYFDQHHLDRCLKVTGTSIVLLTAGNGLIRTESKHLYELTHRRFVMAGPACFHMICVRQPPLHHVPWVQWPGGPDPCSFPEHSPPSSPPWMELTYYPEVDFCPCAPAVEWLHSSVLHLECFSRGALPLHVPWWSESECNLKTADKLKGCLSHSSEPGYDEDPGRERLAGTMMIRCAGQELWNDLRCPRLRSYFHTFSGRWKRTSFELASGGYTVQPGRFSHGHSHGAQNKLMRDLIGLRLETTSLSCQRSEAIEKTVHNASNSTLHPWAMQGHLMPDNLKSLVLGGPDGMYWKFDSDDSGLCVTQPSLEDVRGIPYRYSFFVRRYVGRSETVYELGGQCGQGDPMVWVPCRRAFNLSPMNLWNSLDHIVAGCLSTPAALPYPITPSISSIDEPCPAWKLRNAVKQHLYVLAPRGETEGSHTEHFLRALRVLGGRISIGVDPFEVLENAQGELTSFDSAPQESLRRFEALKEALDELCFGKCVGADAQTYDSRGGAPREAADKPSLDISCNHAGTHFMVQRKQKTLEVRHASIASSLKLSRDWFDLFYDSIYAPPKCFIMVLQWIVCSSNHLVNFISGLTKIAEDYDFVLMRLPIAQLFPQPAPDWSWNDDRETNFQRLPLHPRSKIRLPMPIGGDRGQLYADLLQCWLQSPLNFVFIFASACQDFKCVPTPNPNSKRLPNEHNVFQRLKGWVLSDREGLCLVALREKYIYWYENRLLLFECRDFQTTDQRLQQVERVRRDFYAATDSILLAVTQQRDEQDRSVVLDELPKLSNEGQQDSGSCVGGA